jgi:hypothetical protein
MQQTAEAGQVAAELHSRLLASLPKQQANYFELGAILEEIFKTRAWRAYADSWKAYLASPEIGISEVWASKLRSVFRLWRSLQHHGIDGGILAGIPVGKLSLIAVPACHALEKGRVQEALALVEDARALSLYDLRLRLKGESAVSVDDDYETAQKVAQRIVGQKVIGASLRNHVLTLRTVDGYYDFGPVRRANFVPVYPDSAATSEESSP